MTSPANGKSLANVAPLAGQRIGYARVSTEQESLALQTDALINAGCDRIFEDKPAGAGVGRPGLDAALLSLQRGDALIVWRLDRLGLLTHQLVSLFEKFERDGVLFRSLEDSIDHSTGTVTAILQTHDLLVRMERNLLRERAEAGSSAPRSRGRSRGRSASAASLDTARRLMNTSMLKMDEIAALVGVPRSTLYRVLGPAIIKRDGK